MDYGKQLFGVFTISRFSIYISLWTTSPVFRQSLSACLRVCFASRIDSLYHSDSGLKVIVRVLEGANASISFRSSVSYSVVSSSNYRVDNEAIHMAELLIASNNTSFEIVFSFLYFTFRVGNGGFQCVDVHSMKAAQSELNESRAPELHPNSTRPHERTHDHVTFLNLYIYKSIPY